MNEEYLLNVDLLEHQADFMQLHSGENPVPFPLLVGGYGCGKTFTIVASAIHQLIKYPGLPGAIFEPTYGDIRDIIIPELNRFCDEYNIMHTWNKQSNIYHTSLGQIFLKSMHDPNSIVGFQIAWGFVDEIDTMKPDKAQQAWEKIIARARIPLPDGKPNVVGAATTPEGFGFCYQNWIENKRDGYETVQGKTITSLNAGFVSDSYVKNLMSSYTVELQKAYLEGEFVNLTSGVFYYGFSDENIKSVSLDTSLTIILCFDFNVNPAVACIAQARNAEDIRVVDIVYQENSNTRAVCDEIKEKLFNYKRCDVVIYGDASGNARDTRSNISDYIIIEEELKSYFRSFKFNISIKNPAVRDRENAVNNKLQRNHINIDPSCKELIKDFRQIVRKNNDMDKSNPKLTHISDALGYYIVQEFPIKRKSDRKPRQL